MLGNLNTKELRVLSLFDVFIAYISIVSLVNVALLTLEFFYPLLSLLISFVLLLLFLFIFRIKVTLKHPQFHWLLLVIVIIGLAFRLTPNLYLTGGQDQGTYVSLSKQYEENHGLYIKDEMRDSLVEEAKNIYDKGNVFLGLQLINSDDSKYVMPFYPVFPSWLSTFSTLFGSDNRVYALTLFSLLSIVGTYLFSYELSGRNKKVGLLASFLLSVNPLHVYFSRTPLTEVVSLSFFLFSFYFLIKFYNDYKLSKKSLLPLVLSLLSATVLFYTRMSALLYLPIILLIPVISLLFSKDKRLSKYLSIYSGIWLISFIASYLFYYLFIPDLFHLIIQGRLLELPYIKLVATLSTGLLVIFFASLHFSKLKRVYVKLFSFVQSYLYVIAICIFVGIVSLQLYFFIKEIFIDNGYTFLSFESLSYLKQLSFLTTFLYISPLGFIFIPVILFTYGKKKNVEVVLLIILLSVFLIYCWGILRTTQYHYYFARYQLSELIPLLTVLISMWLVYIYKSTFGKLVFYVFILFASVYFGFFSIVQLKNFEGADQGVFEDLNTIVDDKDILFVARNNFISFNQVVLPLKYYYDGNIFPLYYLSSIENKEIFNLRDRYEDIYILTSLDNIESWSIKLVKEINFKHNYLVHCNREEDDYFQMSSHSPDIPLCEYIIIPNRFYYGTYTMYLYKWEYVEEIN